MAPKGAIIIFMNLLGTKIEYIRSAVFGIEDSLVSTTGLIAGISVGAQDKRIAVLGGMVAIVIEAVSMGASEYLSDDAVQVLEKINRHRERPLTSGVVMFLSYLLAGFIPLLPVVFFPYPRSLIVSVLFALSALFLLGYFKGKLLHTSTWRGALKILLVGGIATAVGVVMGLILRIK